MSDTTTPRRPNWLLLGLADDATITEPEIETHWPVTRRARRNWRHDKDDACPYFDVGGFISYQVGPAREWMRRRLIHRNRRGR